MLTNNYSFIFIDGKLKPICLALREEKLFSIDEQIKQAEKNVESFINGSVYLNMLLWGEKGCGKSSMVKQLLLKYHTMGLRVIQFLNSDLSDLHELYCRLSLESYKFIILFDDISFNYDDERYRSFKSMLEGGIFEQPQNIMIVVTSNRRHLIFEHAYDTDDIYNRDDINESTSLYSRFGLSIGFYPMNINDYLNIVRNYLLQYGLHLYEGWDRDAENFAISRGGRNGRVAKQFAIYKKIYG